MQIEATCQVWRIKISSASSTSHEGVKLTHLSLFQFVSIVILSLLPVAFSQSASTSSNSNPDDNVRVKRAGFSLITGALQVGRRHIVQCWRDLWLILIESTQNLQKSAFSASASIAGGSSSSSASGSSGPSSSGHNNGDNVHSHTYSHSNDYDEPHHVNITEFNNGRVERLCFDVTTFCWDW